MIAVRVTGPMKIAVVGAPTYFARQLPPRTPDDLARHSLRSISAGNAEGDVYAWPFERNRKTRRISVDGRVMVNDPGLLAVRVRQLTGWGSHTRSKQCRSHSCAPGSWSVCWKTGRHRSKDCICIIPEHLAGPGHPARPHRHMIRTTCGAAPAKRSRQNPLPRTERTFTCVRSSTIFRLYSRSGTGTLNPFSVIDTRLYKPTR